MSRARARWTRIAVRTAAVALVPLAVVALPTAAATAGAATHTNGSAITIPPSGASDPYPSSLAVAQPGTITDVNVTLNDYSDTFPSGVGVVLEAPNGDGLLLMAGASDSLSGEAQTITFDDQAANGIPLTGSWGTGSYKPTAHLVPDFPAVDPQGGPGAFANPGPFDGGTATLASVFNGDPATGTWKLWVADSADQSGDDGGAIAGGWSLTITTTDSTTYTLVVDRAGSGIGKIFGPGISCPGDCTETYPAGTPVTLTPFPDEGSHFSGWGGACSGISPCELTLTGNTAVTGVLDRDRHTKPPQTRLTHTPHKKTVKHRARFRFEANESAVTFACRLDDGRFQSCESGRRYRHLTLGEHTFWVRAVNSFNTGDGTPAEYSWTVVPPG